MSDSQTLVFQTLAWERRDVFSRKAEVDEDHEDHEEYVHDFDEDGPFDDLPAPKKQGGRKRLIITVYGRKQDGSSVSLDIEGFRPYFFLKVPDDWTSDDLALLISGVMKIAAKQNINSSDIECERKIGMDKKMYEFDNYTNHAFLRISFANDSSKWELLKALSDDEVNVVDSPTDLRPSVTVPIHIRAGTHRFAIYESTVDSIIRLIDHSDIQPCGWLEAKNLQPAETRTTSRHSHSVRWRDVRQSEVDGIAPFSVSSFDIECSSADGSFPIPNRDPVIQIGMTTRKYGQKLCLEKYIGCLGLCDPIRSSEEKVVVESFKTERDLLLGWVLHLQKIDPDVIIGYNIFGFDWKYLFDRATILGILEPFSKLGRVVNQKSKLEKKMLSSSAMGKNAMAYPVISGRVQIDMLKVIQREHSLPSYKLDDVAHHFMGMNKLDLPPDQIFARFKNGTPTDIRTIAEYCIQDCVLVNDIFDKLSILANNIGMANVCSLPMALLFTRGQGIKTFSLLARECRAANHRFPTLCKLPYGDDAKGVGYDGAVVFDPIPGLYFTPVGVLDYNSLYPSSMIEKNVSHETMVTKPEYLNLPGYIYHEVDIDIKNEQKEVVGTRKCIYAEPIVPKGEKPKKGILPTLLIKLLAARSATKKKMEEAAGTFMESVYNGLQLAYKITANSVYGYCGAQFSELRWQDLAASTTSIGRSRLYFARDEAEKFEGVKVVYGDTDSIFIDCSNHPSVSCHDGEGKLAATIDLSREISRVVCSKLAFPQKLAYEKTFWPFLIITKKRYAGNKYETDYKKYEFVGSGIVLKRRDNAPIVKDIFKGVIDILFKEMNIPKATRFYQDAVEALLEGKVPVDKLVISKRLGEYKDPPSNAHKVLAERMRDRDPGSAPSLNDRVQFVYIKLSNIKCAHCGKGRINADNAKCKGCMGIFCVDHLRTRTHDCQARCRVCWGRQATVCGACSGGFCKDHRSGHRCANIQTKLSQGDIVEDPAYATEKKLAIDYRYYLDHQIQTPVSQVFELIEETKGKDLLKRMTVKDTNQTRGQMSINAFFKKK